MCRLVFFCRRSSRSVSDLVIVMMYGHNRALCALFRSISLIKMPLCVSSQRMLRYEVPHKPVRRATHHIMISSSSSVDDLCFYLRSKLKETVSCGTLNHFIGRLIHSRLISYIYNINAHVQVKLCNRHERSRY